MDAANQNVTDDQELAKVLESMNQQSGGAAVADSTSEPVTNSDGLAFEETPVTSTSDDASPADDASTDTVEPLVEPSIEPIAAPVPDAILPPTLPTDTSDLDSLKKDALEELRPLVDKLDLPPNEKFDTLLLVIRSTDDKTLLGAAHEAAKSIPDETKRAQALLDVIKEIDYFSGHGQAPA